MQIRYLTEDDRRAWDTFLLDEPSFALLQSWDWGVFKEAVGWKVWRVAVEDQGRIIAGAQLLLRRLPLGLSLAYVPRGPVGKWPAPETARLLFAELCRLARSQGAVFLKVEPPVVNEPNAHLLLESCGFHANAPANQPRATILIDLSRGQSAILNNMRKKTRQYVRRAEREGITVRLGTSADLPACHSIMRLTGRRDRFAVRNLHYYQSQWQTLSAGDRAVFLMAYYQERLVAVRMACRFGLYAAEFHAGSMTIPGLHPNYLLAWKAMKWAADYGCTTYDLWGIPDEIAETELAEPLDVAGHEGGLWGVYQFKRGFGTDVVSYIGAYDYVFVPALYRLFNLVLSWGKSWESIAAAFDSPATSIAAPRD